jgi:hypothetical protein
MEYRKLFILIALLLMLQFNGFAQLQNTKQYSIEIGHGLDGCPLGTYFEVCVRYTICTCASPECCTENQLCCTVTKDDPTCHVEIPTNATNVKWIISKYLPNQSSLGSATVPEGTLTDDVSWVCDDVHSCDLLEGTAFQFWHMPDGGEHLKID